MRLRSWSACLLLIVLLPVLPCITAWRLLTGTYPEGYNPHNGYTTAAFVLALDVTVAALLIHAEPWRMLLWLWAAGCGLVALMGFWIARPR